LTPPPPPKIKHHLWMFPNIIVTPWLLNRRVSVKHDSSPFSTGIKIEKVKSNNTCENIISNSFSCKKKNSLINPQQRGQKEAKFGDKWIWATKILNPLVKFRRSEKATKRFTKSSSWLETYYIIVQSNGRLENLNFNTNHIL
jgi:hypothetical protein